MAGGGSSEVSQAGGGEDVPGNSQMSREEILKQLPDDFEKLSLLRKLTGPPSSDDYRPLVVTEKKPLWKSFFEKFNPFVPIGLAATVFFLSNGLRHMVLRNTKKSQMMMRGRVTAQGFTLVAIVGGVLYETYRKRRSDKADLNNHS